MGRGGGRGKRAEEAAAGPAQPAIEWSRFCRWEMEAGRRPREGKRLLGHPRVRVTEASEERGGGAGPRRGGGRASPAHRAGQELG